MTVKATLQYHEILERADRLRAGHDQLERRRIRAVMNGGAEAVQAILGWGHDGPEGDIRDLGNDLPTANIMWSGLERLAQRIGRMPTLKTNMVPLKDSQTARKAAEKRQRIVGAWDEMDRLEMQFPQMGRWLPGYGFAMHQISETKRADYIYPRAELRDPYDVFPGFWGPDQQPTEIAVFRRVDYKALQSVYGSLGPRLDNKRAGGVVILGASWEGTGDVEVVEYHDIDGTYIVCRETQDLLTFIPNPLSSGPAFVMTKRFSFDTLKSQYTHVFGLMSEMAKLNLLGMIAAEDSNFRETNVFGEMDSTKYMRGREAINFFQPGARVEKPTGDFLQQTFQAINVLERQMRTVSGYDVQQDGVSPNSFATGQGMKELQSSADNNVREYQTAIKHSMELIDRKRLEWDDVMHPNLERKVFWYEGSTQNEESYTPSKDIKGDYRTKRVFGAMATFDDTQKLLAGMQLLGARVIDTRTLQENLDGFADDSISLINERILQDQARDALLSSMGQRSAEGDPAADSALISMLEKPSGTIDTLKKFFTAEDPALSPEEAALMAQAQGAPPGQDQLSAPPPIQTVLTQMEGEGGGAQTVAVNR
jgi:hypothetical protein